MADITSARLLGRVLKTLAQNGIEFTAHKIFMDEVPFGDFHAYQMEADEALVKLGLAREMTPEEAEKEGVETGLIYAHEKGF